jgi:hypothetical protein
MTVPMLTRDQAGAAVKAAVAERDAIQANLLELDSSFGKQLLTGAELRRPPGTSAPESSRRSPRCSPGARSSWPRAPARWLAAT